MLFVAKIQACNLGEYNFTWGEDSMLYEHWQKVVEDRRNEIALKAQSLELAAARDAAEAGARVKGAFLATMSHEIRTPLNGVIGMTELLEDTSLSTDQREYTSTIRKSGEALLAIINDILDFSKIEAGKLELEDAQFPLFTVIEECVEIVAPEAHRKGLELILPLPSGNRTHVRGDQSRLRHGRSAAGMRDINW